MKKKALWALVVIWGITCLYGSHGCQEQERVALLTLNATLDLTYRADAGGSYFNCCSWEGVECNPTTGRVTHLMLSNYYRFGFKTWYLNASLLLPFEELKSLDLSSNYLGGWIAPEEPNLLFSRLSKLEVLDLSDNSLDDSIMSILGTIPSLWRLFLSGNNLSGTLHMNGGFSNLMELDISDNAIDAMATIEGIKNLSHLENLHLDHVQLKFVGTVVRALGALSSLRILSLRYNTIEGTITTQDFHNFSKLEQLILDGSSLNTSIGILSGLGSLTSLRLLSSSNTGLSGNLSDHSLCNLVKLEELDLSFNGIIGGLPTCWRNMSSIRILHLEDNEVIDSGVSSPLTSLTSLEFLSISGNHIDISSSLGPLANHSRLKVLILDDTKLTIDTKVASLIPRFQLKVLSMSSSPSSRGFKLTSLGFLKHQYDLRIFDLSSNDIPGPFPAWLLENNTKLEMLFMANNLFTTFKVPSMTLFNLSSMDISNNNMRGELTTEFCANVPNLLHLNLSANRLEGNIPSELGSIKFLDILDLSSNNFLGGLPIQLLDSKLFYLNVAYNNLQGEIGLSNHTMNPGLQFLRLDHNLFTGSLSFLSSLFDLQVLDISNNIFSGKLPRLIANMSSLMALDLSKNHLDGVIPQELCNLPGLEYLDLSSNNFSGPLPSFFILPYMRRIHLSRNKLNGTLMHALSNSSHLVTLDLSENEFFGSIPNWLGNLSQLNILSLRGNSLCGTFPEQLCRLKRLSMIDLSENNLSGPLPNCLGPLLSEHYIVKVTSAPSVQDVILGWSPWSYVRTIKSHTEFFYKEMKEKFEAPHTVGFTMKGRFDSYKGYVLKMVGLDFSCNQFSGEIPSEIAILQEMVVLNLSHNKLTGRIPMSLSNLTKIESIDLSYNNLIGSIPKELTQLNSLEIFNVSYNDLSRAIPNKNQFGSFDKSSYYGNDLLCGLPLSKKCLTTINVNCSATKSCAATKEDGFIDEETFYISFGVSYSTVGLVIPIVLFINPQWRHAWFHYVELVITTCQSLFITCYYFVQDSFRKLSRGQTF